MTTENRKFNIRFAKVEDHAALMQFYAENPHENVCDRHSDLVKDLADKGSVILVEEKSTGDIVGVSISYPLFVKQGEIEQEKWLEIGTTRMVLNGYAGLFDVMIGLQVLRAYLVEPPDGPFVCQMTSPMVQAMAKKLGFHAITPSDELVATSDKTLDIGTGDTYGYDNWYAAGPEMLPVMAKHLVEALEKPYLEHYKTGEKIEIDVSQSSFYTTFKDEIQKLSGRNLGDPQLADETKSIAKNRDEWMRSFFK